MIAPDLARSAFRLAMRGLHVFPVAPGTKVPVKGTHGCRSATQDLDVVRAWWAKWPSANIGIATGPASGVWVLDLDVKGDVQGVDVLDDAQGVVDGVVDGAVDGRASLRQLEARHGPLPVTITVTTPSGGSHYYWRWPAGIQIRNSTGRIGPDLDVRGQGGSAVVPPSVLASGGRYRWAGNGARLADAPAWLVTLALPPPPPPRPKPKPLNGDVDRYVAAAAVSELAELEAAKEGTRNDALNRASFSLACFVKAGALPEDWARGQLEARAIGIGLPVVEARGTINSAFRAAQPRDLPR